MFVCSCKAITESQIRRMSRGGLPLPVIARELGLDDEECCGRCLRDLDRLIMLAREADSPRALAVAG
jgi:bacterioferritin-associated ferredoxin